MQAAEELLFDGAVINPLLREAAIDNWAVAIREKLKHSGKGIEGTDDSSTAYLDEVKAIIDPMKNRVPTTLGIEMMAALADKLESQRGLSYYFEEAYSITKTDLERSDDQLRALEALMIVFSQKKDARFKLIDFLTAPRTDEHINNFARVLKEELGDESLFAKADVDINEANDFKYDVDGQKESEEYFRIKAEQFYESYWRMPLILFPERVSWINYWCRLQSVFMKIPAWTKMSNGHRSSMITQHKNKKIT